MLLPKPPNNKDYATFYLYGHLKNFHEYKAYIDEITVSKNELIYRPPTYENYIYEVVEGAIKLGSYSDCGNEHAHDILTKGDLFGNLRYLNGQFFEFSKTLVDSKIRVYDLGFFKKTIVRDPDLADWFISYLLKRWCSSEKKLDSINGNNIQERIQYLQFQFNIDVTDANGNRHVLFELLTQKDLGDLIGATRQTVSTILKKNQSFLSKIPG
ncbi:Crp/Fnr family transcriptional regulator [Maribacter sp. 2210JD10-5]|uniref:Crp/Fnr family transcriptional regulator n=1 Tax=Maribacter sp. 2210JD10-5 TaxID=3386272 RepID=UPI0039BC3D46